MADPEAPTPAAVPAARPRRLRRALSLLGWALLYAAIVAGILLQRSPHRIGPREVPMQGGSAFPEARADALALLVLPPAFDAAAAHGQVGAEAAAAQPGATPRAPAAARFSTLDPAQAWGNWLLQEFGSLRTATIAELDTLDLERLALVVVPAGCEGRFTEALRERLERFAAEGGVVVCERSQPDRPSRSAAAAESTTVGFAVPARSVTIRPWFRPGLADTATMNHLVGCPMKMSEQALALTAPSWEALVQSEPPVWGTWPDSLRDEQDDHGRRGLHLSVPASVAIRRTGAGGTLALDLAFARDLLTWQQGKPADDFSIPPRYRAQAGVPFCQPNALVPDARLLATLYPHADAWERLLAACVESVRPVPRLWYFPYPYDGAWAMTHDDEDFGDLARWMTEEEKRQGAASTLYSIPKRLTAAGAGAMTADGCDLALHWWRGWSDDLTRPVGLLGWTPLRRVWSLTEQRDHLQSLLPAGRGPVISNRVHGLIWDAHYTRDFRRLEAAGFCLDSTYGPAGRAQLGYQFGTGFPFHPLDTDGRPFRLLEVPFLYQDDENWRPDLDETLLRDSATSLHELLVPLYHATTMSWQPSVEVMEGYLSAFERARRWNHWITTLEGYRRFWERRAATRIARGGRPGEYVTPAGVGGAPAVAADDLALMVPPGARLLAADGSEPTGRQVELMGRDYRLVPLSALGGRFTLEARP